MALQFAKSKGAYVIGTASEHNFDFLKQLGADEVIDYKNNDFASLTDKVDVVFDASPVRDEEARMNMAATLKEGGIFVTVQIAYPFSNEFLEVLANKHAEGKMIRRELDVSQSLTDIAKLIEAGKVKVVISKVYPLEKVAEAQLESETKHVRGKIVLEIRKEN